MNRYIIVHTGMFDQRVVDQYEYHDNAERMLEHYRQKYEGHEFKLYKLEEEDDG